MIEQVIEIPTPDGISDSVLYSTETGSRLPAVIFLTNIGGIRPSQRQMAQRLASEGYTVLVPNVFYRTGRPPIFDFPLKSATREQRGGLNHANKYPIARHPRGVSKGSETNTGAGLARYQFISHADFGRTGMASGWGLGGTWILCGRGCSPSWGGTLRRSLAAKLYFSSPSFGFTAVRPLWASLHTNWDTP